MRMPIAPRMAFATAAIGGTIRQARELIEANHETMELMQIRNERHSKGTSK